MKYDQRTNVATLNEVTRKFLGPLVRNHTFSLSFEDLIERCKVPCRCEMFPMPGESHETGCAWAAFRVLWTLESKRKYMEMTGKRPSGGES